VIAVDTSILVAIAIKEEGHEPFNALLQSRLTLLPVSVIHETHAVLRSRNAVGLVECLDDVLTLPSLTIASFTADHLRFSRDAFDRYGRGRGHPAQLNFGDCLVYATAKLASVPLLFKGNDFIHTDITPAYSPA
jgi:ribonuclease VapC